MVQPINGEERLRGGVMTRIGAQTSTGRRRRRRLQGTSKNGKEYCTSALSRYSADRPWAERVWTCVH